MWTPKNQDPDSEQARMMRMVSIAVTIPFVLLLSPFVGWGLGWWVGGFLGHAQIGGVVGLAFGLAAGVTQTVDLVRRVLRETK